MLQSCRLQYHWNHLPSIYVLREESVSLDVSCAIEVFGCYPNVATRLSLLADVISDITLSDVSFTSTLANIIISKSPHHIILATLSHCWLTFDLFTVDFLLACWSLTFWPLIVDFWYWLFDLKSKFLKGPTLLSFSCKFQFLKLLSWTIFAIQVPFF